MKGDSLEDDQTLVRWVRKGSLRRDPNNPKLVIGVNPDAFKHREAEEYLSATWSEFFDADPDAGMAASVAMFRVCLRDLKNSGYAIGKVGPIKAACAGFGATIRVIHEPDPPNDGHVALRRVPRDNEALRARLAFTEWSRVVLDSDFPPSPMPAAASGE